ncbi:hypothetical protein PMI29_01612 [Pseudomonas sp. GM49]|uniref:hypothetical protein n=1 Tax=Pseudomonas sp. GM49 TaxID=1144331 RepID=UPI000270B160|nr:hypothetical protein [Pseudomonas sp. GM49]EJM70451.1 hypothetical protein PMI29_01612 [Pseudomonas sp. GM49]
MTPEQIDKTLKIINRAEEILQTAQYGLDDLKSSNGQRRLAGLRNLVVFGRSVTFVIQNLSSVVDDFNGWYAPIQKELASSPVMNYFKELRNEVLKQGRLETGISGSASFSGDELMKQGKRPFGAKGFIIGDMYGGSGWIVELPDGSEITYYVDLPKTIGDFKLVFSNIPEKFKSAIGETSVEKLAEDYLKSLAEIIDSCRSNFLDRPVQKIGSIRLPPYLRVIK